MNLKKLLTTLALTATLATSTYAAPKPTFTVMPTVNQTTRIKYRNKDFYSFADIENKYFAKAEQFYKLKGPIGVQGEIKSFATLDDQIRLAVTVQPKIKKKNKAFVRFCYFPKQLNSWRKNEASLLAKKSFGRLTTKLYTNTDFKRTYLEPTLLWKLNKKSSAFIQGRGFNSHGMKDLKYLGGLSINF
ncbi:MAG: hypothetical protein U9R08_01435 [Nanoarchaeota archaeon]|nr:hypothetical protein [Nanoarchaeota archaeon]